MKKVYVIAPLILLAGFVVYYRGFSAELVKKEIAEKQRVASIIAEEEAKRTLAEEKARQDADAKRIEREAEEAQKAADKAAKWEKESAEIAASIADYQSAADKNQALVNKLEIQLTELRRKKEELNAKAFAALKDVELARSKRNAAELEVQRLTAMVAKEAEDSIKALAARPATTTS